MTTYTTLSTIEGENVLKKRSYIDPPETLNGKNLVFKEVFKSPFERNTPKDAYRVLCEIRENHPSRDGWVEFGYYIEKLPNEKYRAVRNHAQYK